MILQLEYYVTRMLQFMLIDLFYNINFHKNVIPGCVFREKSIVIMQPIPHKFNNNFYDGVNLFYFTS